MTGGPKSSWIQALGEEFATEPGNSVMGPVNLLGVPRKDGNWIITASGRWKAEVVLDDKYEVVSARRVE
jgi:hypothetical protein